MLQWPRNIFSAAFVFVQKKRLSASAASTALIAAPLKALPEGMPSSFRSTNAEFNCFVPLGRKFFENFLCLSGWACGKILEYMAVSQYIVATLTNCVKMT
ncbi:hypothetical protein HUU40_26340 [candidate division KSB1 bacterium]|nr:hypothetical protein [candidate division KSB1 bacterium]